MGILGYVTLQSHHNSRMRKRLSRVVRTSLSFKTIQKEVDEKFRNFTKSCIRLGMSTSMPAFIKTVCSHMIPHALNPHVPGSASWIRLLLSSMLCISLEVVTRSRSNPSVLVQAADACQQNAVSSLSDHLWRLFKHTLRVLIVIEINEGFCTTLADFMTSKVIVRVFFSAYSLTIKPVLFAFEVSSSLPEIEALSLSFRLINIFSSEEVSTCCLWSCVIWMCFQNSF